MQTRQLSDGLGREPAQEAAQGGIVGKLLQSDPRHQKSIAARSSPPARGLTLWTPHRSQRVDAPPLRS